VLQLSPTHALQERSTAWPAALGWRGWSALFLCLAAVFLFANGLAAPLALKDESRNANNALDMAISGFSLVTTYDFRPDLWNTKPPLVIWLMSGSLRLFGFNEWALRLPSALAAMATLACTLWFVRKVTGSMGVALGSAILLLLSPGFFGEHGARTGDFDAVLLLFVTGGLQLLYLALLQRRPPWLLLLASGGLIALGALSKSVAAFIPVTGTLIFILVAGRLRPVLACWPRYGLAFVAALGPLLAFFAAREWMGPGYLSAIVQNDMTGRFGELTDVEATTPTFYLEHLVKGWFFAGPLLLLIPLGLRKLGPRERALALYAGCVVLGALAIYSAAATRAMQYALPLFPWLAMLVAIALKRLLRTYVIAPWSDGQRLMPLALGCALCLLGTQLTARAMWWRFEMFPARQSGAQASYGNLFAALAARGVSQVTVIDPGFGRREERGYAPLIRWHRLVWERKGLAATHLLSEPAAASGLLASCEPDVFNQWHGPTTERIGLCAIRWPARP
jgi:4-amino-4-deoxy-L-arabinose transferase-like glycosyltransferase